MEEDFEFDQLMDNGDYNDNDATEAEDFNEVTYEAHDKLLKSVESVLTSKLKPKENELRTEAASIISKSTLSKRKGGLSVESFLKSIEKKDKNLVKDLKKKVKKQVLDKPLHKPAAQKITRSILYENAKKEVGKWDSVVQHNRLAEQLIFPLTSEKKVPKTKTKDVAADFVPETPLEEEIAKILHGEEFIKKRKQALYEKDPEKTENEQYMLSIEEALEQHHEAARLRALHSYETTKARRRNKIKSKKYHRILRREKIKKQMKEFEELKKSNPEAAMEKLEELEKARVNERMSLKHRNTTKWAKMHAARAKYDRESREVLADQLKISRELTTKRIESSDDDEEEEEPETSMPMLVQSSVTNPSQSLINIRNHLNIGGSVGFDLKKGSQAVDFDIFDDDEDEDNIDNDEQQKNLIAEAFEDDDVITSFQRKKQDEIDKEKPTDINLTLPGWGEWGGTNIKPSKKKQEKFVIKGKPAPARKDSKLPHVILNSEANDKLKSHQVREVPFPFVRVKEFEKMVRAPIGRTWMPEQSMKSLISPKVITRLGAVIQPISEEMLAKKPESGSKQLKLAGLTMSRSKKASS